MIWTRRTISMVTILAMVGSLVYLPSQEVSACAPDSDGDPCCCSCSTALDDGLPGVERESCCVMDGEAPPATPEVAVTAESTIERSLQHQAIAATPENGLPGEVSPERHRADFRYHDLSPPHPRIYQRNCALLI